MSASETLKAVAAGERVADGLLHTCRLHAFGVEHHGEEAIVESFRGAPIAIGDGAVWVEADGHLAIFESDTALIADLYEGGIGRLWRLGPGAPGDAEPRVDVAFDPDLAQARGDLLFAASDHPALAVDGVDQVVEIGRSLARDDSGAAGGAAYRTRAFVLRAFGDAASGAALFVLYRLGPDQVRTSGFSTVAAIWSADATRIVFDLAGEAAVARAGWSPRIAP